MPTSNKDLKKMLDEVAETLLFLVHEKYEVMPNDARPEAIWTMLAEMTNGIIGACKRLATMSDRVSPDMILKDISGDTGDEVALAMGIIKGAQRSSRIGRSVIFDEESRNLPSPRKNLDSTCAVQTLHEMVFFDSDCFLSLSSIQPGYHGWIIIFRDELKDWLLSAVEPFHVLYEDPRGKRRYFGIYTARLLSGANMSGAEIACLKDSVGEIIVTALSRSERGSKPYKTLREKLLLSLETLPCIFLQCIEYLPVMYPNFMNDVQLAQQVPARLAPPPPRLTAPEPFKRESQHFSSNLPNQLRTVPVPECEHQQTQSSLHIVRPAENENSLKGTSPSTVRNYSSASYDTPSSYHNRWYNFGDSDNVLRGSNRAFAGHQTWNQDHQNKNLVNNSDRVLGPVRGTGIRPLQFSAHNNYQARNPQSNPILGSHNCSGTRSSNSGCSKSQSYSATHGVPRGYQVQNQNIDPICNPPPIRTQFTRSSRGLYPQNVSSCSPTRLPSQNFPFSQHRKANPGFSQSHPAQRMQ